MAGINETLDVGGAIPDEIFDQLIAAAPVDIREATVATSEALKGSPEDAFGNPEVQAAGQEIAAYQARNC